MNYTKISVITTAYNQENYIARCLRSLVNQTLDKSRFEIILVDDGSKDKTNYAMRLFSNPYDYNIEILENSTNKGLPYSLNKAINFCKGEYVVRVDADDYVNNNFLQFLSTYLDLNKESNAVACDYNLVDDKGNFISRINCNEHNIGCGIMFKKSTIMEIGLYDNELLMNEEVDLRIRYETKYKIERLAIPLYRYRQHDTNMTKNTAIKLKYDEKLAKKYQE